MRRSTMRRVAAVALFGGYLALWLYGWLDIEPSNVPQISRELFWGLAIGGPCFLVGAAVARWWMPAAVGLFLVALLPLGDRCVQARDLDLVSITCSGVDGVDLPLLLAITTPCVLAGVLAVRLGTAAFGRWGAGPPAGATGLDTAAHAS